MKRSSVLVPAILVALFLLNSFVLKEKDAANIDKYKPGRVNTVLKSIDGGRTWQDISKTPPDIDRLRPKGKVVQSEGVLIAPDAKGIIRSTDDGKHWQLALSEGGAGIAVERIKGGFAAITYNTATQSRRIRISLDKGKTWQAIDNGLPPSISSIKQMGKYLICGDMGGLFRSADMGKTWSRVRCAIIAPNEVPFYTQYIIRPPVDANNVLKLYVSGDALYAVAEPAGC